MAEKKGQEATGQITALEQASLEKQWLRNIAQRGTLASGALRELINAYEPKVLGFCIRRGMALADAEDLLQDLWTRVYEHAANFNPNQSPSPWLWAIARNLWHDEMRKLYKRRADVGGQDLESLSEAAEAVPAPNCTLPGKSAAECVQRGLQSYGRVHDEGATAVQLRDLEGWDIPDLAQFLGRSEGATRTFLSQIRKKLEPFLKPCFELLSS